VAPRIRYERETCGRCGGGGQYSYNARHGSTCYGCGGSGVRLSRRGRKARERVEAFKAERCGVLARDVRPGDVLANMPAGLGSTFKRARVTESGPSGSRYLREGEWLPFWEIRYSGHGYAVTPETRLTRVPTPAEWAEIVALAATLPGVEIIEPEATAEGA
jgi:hypothetical protein